MHICQRLGPQIFVHTVSILQAKMEKIPNEILLKIFSYLEVEDLGRCATVSKQYHKIAYVRRLWQKLAINLIRKKVPVQFLQHIMKHGIAFMNLDFTEIVGDSLQFSQQNSLKYLILDFKLRDLQSQREVKKNLLASCTQLKKLSCSNIDASYLDDVFQCIGQNSESLQCLEIEILPDLDKMVFDILDDMMTTKINTAINKCNNLEELRVDYYYDHIMIMDLITNLPQNLKKLCLCWLKIEELKVLVATCSKLEDLFLKIYCCEDSTCHHIDEVISILVGSPLADTLVNLSLTMERINVNDQLSVKCLDLKKMKKLKKLKIVLDPYYETTDMTDMLKKNLPHLTILEDIQEENFFIPAYPYAKHKAKSGFWEIRCNRLSVEITTVPAYDLPSPEHKPLSNINRITSK